MILNEEDRNQLEDSLEQVIGKHAFDAIEAAVLAKLVSAKLPVPTVWKNHDFEGWNPSPYIDALDGGTCETYTADQLHQAYAQGAASHLCKK